MTIEGINSLESIQPGKKQGPNNRPNEAVHSDSIKISSEALEKGEFYQAVELVSSAPDVRTDRIAELKKKINDPSYIDDTIVQATADKIMEAFGL
jgi:negative regulator of flagellin synthesis FlgM